MAEYIDRAVCLLILRAKANMAVLMDAAPYFEKAAQMLEKLPAADVAPVVHGRWEYDLPTINTYGQLRCSICNWWTLDPSVDRSYSYCPNCGAKMDGGDNDAKSM